MRARLLAAISLALALVAFASPAESRPRPFCILASLVFGTSSFEMDCTGSFRTFESCNRYLVKHAKTVDPPAYEGVGFRCISKGPQR